MTILAIAVGALATAPVQAATGSAALPVAVLSWGEDYKQALECLSAAIAHEAGREPQAGREAVAQVVMNRLRAPAYPKTVCGVVFQGSQRRTGCQFTFTCDGALFRHVPAGILAAARQTAAAALIQALPDHVSGATHYHASYVAPAWAGELKRVARIGAHIFYRPAGGGMPAAMPTVPIMTPAASETPASDSARPFSAWGLPLPGEG